MSLLEINLGETRHWSRVGDGYEVTKKPRNLDRATLPAIAFAAMDAIPQDGIHAGVHVERAECDC